MTRDQLEKYHDITVRLKALRTTVVTDLVKGSFDEYPFTSHSVAIHGVRCDAVADHEKELLIKKKEAIDRYIEEIEDVRAKTLLDMHYRKGKQWATIASVTGCSIDANEKYLQRFFQCP